MYVRTHPPAPSLPKRGGEEEDAAATPTPPSLCKRRGVGDEFQESQLQVQHQQVEAFGAFVFFRQGRGQSGQMVAQFGLIVVAQRIPGAPVSKVFSLTVVRAHQEIVRIHGRHFGMQQVGKLISERRQGIVVR